MMNSPIAIREGGAGNRGGGRGQRRVVVDLRVRSRLEGVIIRLTGLEEKDLVEGDNLPVPLVARPGGSNIKGVVIPNSRVYRMPARTGAGISGEPGDQKRLMRRDGPGMVAGYTGVRLLWLQSVKGDIDQYRSLSIDLPVAEILIEACRAQIVRRLRQDGPQLLIGERRILGPQECSNTRDVRCCH